MNKGPNYRHECPECGKRFITPSKLARHVLMHTGERPYTCPHCLRPFSQASNMRLHIQKIHGDYSEQKIDPALYSDLKDFSLQPIDFYPPVTNLE